MMSRSSENLDMVFSAEQHSNRITHCSALRIAFGLTCLLLLNVSYDSLSTRQAHRGNIFPNIPPPHLVSTWSLVIIAHHLKLPFRSNELPFIPLQPEMYAGTSAFLRMELPENQTQAF